jgi:hypothetical protein
MVQWFTHIKCKAEESDANVLLGPVLDHATTPARPNQQVMIHESAGGGGGGAAEVVAEEAAASNGNPSAGAGEAEDGGRRPAEDGGRHDHVRRQNTGFDAVTL